MQADTAVEAAATAGTAIPSPGGTVRADKRHATSLEQGAPTASSASFPKRARLADAITPASAGSREWAEVIAEQQPAIVALRVTCVRTFEEDSASTSLGTGFVVDSDRGLILTNRHITGVGPVRATALFDRFEELEVEVLYRDPIHDFGFFRYNPAKLRRTRQAEIQLDPAGLTVGTEIRVVGNDAGEKLQILSGTIARIDRNVPEFHTLYNDENTFYAGAGAGTSGGSSGSPVLNKQGRAIALNAAGQEGTASAYFLPLDRVKYTLDRLQQGLPAPRGTCLASFLFKPFDELSRVGLQERHEHEVLASVPDATGMLVVDAVLCEQKLLRPGDILLRLEDKVCVGFTDLEAWLDAHVGEMAPMLICRQGTEMLLSVKVEDLHAMVPRSFMELGLDILHDMGYHCARRAHLPLDSGLYLARSGYVFESLGCPKASLVTSVCETPTPTLQAFVDKLKQIPDRQHFQVTWYDLQDFRRDRTLRTGFAKMARSWSPMRLWHCERDTGKPEVWVATDIPPPQQAASISRPLAPAARLSIKQKSVMQVQSALVTTRFRTDRRFITEVAFGGTSEGVGLLIDAEQGLVLTDRHSAPQTLGDAEVTFAGSIVADAEVIFLHPVHNIAVVRCDPAVLKQVKPPLRPASLATGLKAELRPGEMLHFVGFDHQNNAFNTEVKVAAVYLPSGRDEFPMLEFSRFRQRNLEIAVLADTPEDARGGVLCDANGVVRALFAAYDLEESTEAFGVPVSAFGSVVEELRQDISTPPKVPSLDIEVNAMDLATLVRGAASNPLPESWLQAVSRRCHQRGQVPRALVVHRVMASGASHGLLKPGDVLLSIAGEAIATALDMERAVAGTSSSSKKTASIGKTVLKRPAASASKGAPPPSPHACVQVYRKGAAVDVNIKPTQLSSQDDGQLLVWAGLVLRRTPRSILERSGDSIIQSLSGVFAQAVLGGSPADARDLRAFWCLLEIDGHAVPDLPDVLKVLKEVQASAESDANPRRWVRLRFVDLNGQEHVGALQCDPLFFPTLELHRVSGGRWRCVQH
mmetsp:Transcript_10388/g.23488  ORF Transcript_10388/g.23488 Transcript_10388/m.23488 type:complete len:1038 (+) Transcript_10388:79-3192(+)